MLKDVPSRPDEDPRLHDASGDVDNGYRYPYGPRRGQPGWDLGLTIDRIDQLPSELAGRKFPGWLGGGKIEHGSMTGLAICAHGAPGTVAVMGSAEAGEHALGAAVHELPGCASRSRPHRHRRW